MLELAFATRELRSACEDAACAEALYGQGVARALVGRIADLRAAGNPLELPIAERLCNSNAPEHIVITLAEGRTLVIGANHSKPPRVADGTLDWERVNRVIILRLE